MSVHGSGSAIDKAVPTSKGLVVFFRGLSPVRWWSLAVVGAATAGAVVVDALSSFWVLHPVVAGLVVGVLLLLVAALLVDAWSDYRAAQAWLPVAAFALEDLGTLARAVWVRHASFIDHPGAPIHLDAFRQQVTGPAGESRQRTNLDVIVQDVVRRSQLFDLLYASAERTRDLLIRWSPVMVGRAPLVGYLSRFADMHRLMVQTLQWMSHERSGRALPVGTERIRDQVLSLNSAAESLDRDCFKQAAVTAPLVPTDPLITEVT